MKKLFVMIFTVLAIVTMPIQQAKAASLAEIQDKGELVLGMSADYPPYEWVQMVDGQPEIVGIDVALGQLIADEIGVELVIDNRSFDSLIPSLQSNRIDIIISGMAHNEERAEQVDFSQPYFTAVSQFAVGVDDVGNYTSLEDFTGKTIGVQQGSIQETYVRDNMPESDFISLSNNGDLMESLKAKRVDAVMISDLALAQYLIIYADSAALVENVDIANDGVGSSVAITKGNTDLLELIDSVITEAKESGQMDEIFDEYTQLAGQNIAE